MIDISKVTDSLYVGSRINKEQAAELELFKFDLIISMIAQLAPDEVYTHAPFKTLWIRTYDSIFLPIAMKQLLTGVEAALPIIEKKGKVLVFCMQGKHRSIAMAAAILIGLGNSSQQAMELLMAARKEADPRIWYIRWRIQAFERYWHEKYYYQEN